MKIYLLVVSLIDYRGHALANLFGAYTTYNAAQKQGEFVVSKFQPFLLSQDIQMYVKELEIST